MWCEVLRSNSHKQREAKIYFFQSAPFDALKRIRLLQLYNEKINVLISDRPAGLLRLTVSPSSFFLPFPKHFKEVIESNIFIPKPRS